MFVHDKTIKRYDNDNSDNSGKLSLSLRKNFDDNYRYRIVLSIFLR
jgi:hypothetical protein